MARTNNLSNFLTDVAAAIRTKKGSEELIAAADFDTEIENLPSGGGIEAPFNDVNFYDYDGFRAYSYTAQEFLALEEMPANPEHDGLTAQGWNWSLVDAQDYVENYGVLDVGQMYKTDDDTIRLYVDLTDATLHPYIRYCVPQSGVSTIINWGDGNTETITTTSLICEANHEYLEKGSYVIKIKFNYELNSSNPYKLTESGSNSYNSGIFYGGDTTLSNKNYIYYCCLKKVELADYVVLSNYAFYRYYNLEKMTMPEHCSFTQDAMQDLNALKILITPSNHTTAQGTPTFTGCNFSIVSLTKDFCARSTTDFGYNNFNFSYKLKRLVIPDNVTSIGQKCANNLYNVGAHIIPKSITSIGNQSFSTVYGSYMDFSKHEQVPTLDGTYSCRSNNPDYKIIVPDNLYEDWIAATNWSKLASYIIKKTDWDALQNA